MLTINKIGGHNNKKSAELYALAKDEKPMDGIPNGTSLYIIDYKEAQVAPLWMFDEENKRWLEQ